MKHTADRPAGGRHARPAGRRARPRRKHKFTGLLLGLLFTAALAAGGIGLHGFWAGAYPAKHSLPAPAQPRVVLLDENWTDLLALQPGGAAMRAAIDQAVAGAAALPGGVNALAWSGRTSAGQALFRDGTETLPQAENLAAEDLLLAKFDAMQYLVAAAKKAGLAVYLDAGARPDAAAQALAQKHSLTTLTHPGAAASTVTAAACWQAGDTTLLWYEGQPETTALALQQGRGTGAVLGRWSMLQADPTDAVLLNAFWHADAPADPAAAWPEKAVQQSLAVTYPTKNNTTLYTKTVFLMGTSDPAQPLTLNGTPVERFGTDGVWGILLDLEQGENTFALANGADTLDYTVVRGKTAAAKKTKSKPDGTPGEEAVGKKVVITDPIASALRQCWDSSSISQTLYQGAAAEIVAAVEYDTGTKLTHAYQLSTGDYIRAAACTIQDLPDAAFTGVQVYEDAPSRCTVLEFAGSGSPAVFHTWEGDTLTLTFLSAQLAGSLPANGRFTAQAAQTGSDLTLTLTFDPADPLYGWAVNYKNDTTYIYLKHRPALAPGEKPLDGVTVMLDPGHGASDLGAMGSAGLNAPVEKEVNLAVALAARQRLEQLGATVVMTRTEDTFPTLGDRVTAMNQQHPDLFISVHHNSIDLTVDVNKTGGTEAYWFYDEGEPLAHLLTQNVTEASAAAGYPRSLRGVYYGYYYVTRSNICPATLLEVGFMTSPAEYEAVTETAVIQAEGLAIAKSVYQYLQNLNA